MYVISASKKISVEDLFHRYHLPVIKSIVEIPIYLIFIRITNWWQFMWFQQVNHFSLCCATGHFHICHCFQTRWRNGSLNLFLNDGSYPDIEIIWRSTDNSCQSISYVRIDMPLYQNTDNLNLTVRNWLIIDRPDYLIDVIQFLRTKHLPNDDDFGNTLVQCECVIDQTEQGLDIRHCTWWSWYNRFIWYQHQQVQWRISRFVKNKWMSEFGHGPRG